MKSAPGWQLSLVVCVALASFWNRAAGPSEPESVSLSVSALRPAAVENATGGFILYQPFNDADGQIPGEPYSKNDKQYSVTTVRWAVVGFLRVEEGEEEGEIVEHWYLSKADTASTVTESLVPFVEVYFWPGRSSPNSEKHIDWNDLPIRFVRRNDLSGAVDLDAFVAEVASVYGFTLAANAGKFERYDHKAAKAAGY